MHIENHNAGSISCSFKKQKQPSPVPANSLGFYRLAGQCPAAQGSLDLIEALLPGLPCHTSDEVAAPTTLGWLPPAGSLPSRSATPHITWHAEPFASKEPVPLLAAFSPPTPWIPSPPGGLPPSVVFWARLARLAAATAPPAVLAAAMCAAEPSAAYPSGGLGSQPRVHSFFPAAAVFPVPALASALLGHGQL